MLGIRTKNKKHRTCSRTLELFYDLTKEIKYIDEEMFTLWAYG